MDDLILKVIEGKGIGVVSGRLFNCREKVLDYTGPVMTWKNFDSEHHDFSKFIQVGEDAFIGSSGGFDDYVNHSCSPNCVLLLNPPHLVALKDILTGEEITFDYSITSMDNPENWQMECNCKSPICRGLIGGFSTLPISVKIAYIIMGIVPDYIYKNLQL